VECCRQSGCHALKASRPRLLRVCPHSRRSRRGNCGTGANCCAGYGSDTIPADSSWMRPNRRHIWNGLYLPGVVREGVREIAVAVDCSGSVNGRLCVSFEAEVCSILEGQRPTMRSRPVFRPPRFTKWRPIKPGRPFHLNPVGAEELTSVPCFDWLGRARHSAADAGLSDRPLRDISRRRSSLSRDLGINRRPSCAFRKRRSQC